jgi:hypothetical protein
MRRANHLYVSMLPGISCGDAVDARELGLSSPGRQLYPKGP